MSRVEELSQRILKVLSDERVDDVDEIRRAIGLTMTSIHTALIVSAKTKESQRRAVETVIDTINRLVQSVNDTMKREGIGEIAIERVSQSDKTH